MLTLCLSIITNINFSLQQLQTENRRLVQTNSQLEQRVKELKVNDSRLRDMKNVEEDLKKKIEELVSLQQKMSLSLKP